MRQAAGKTSTTSKDSARRIFWVTAIDTGWRLALIVLVPLIAGAWADRKFDSEPSFTLAAFFVAIATATVFIAKTYKQMQVKAADLPKDIKRQKKPEGAEDKDGDDY